MKKHKIVTLLFAMFLSVQCFAFEDYKCSIKGVFTLDEKGNLSDKMTKIYLGKEFTVERQTGVMAGILKNSYVTEPIVIDYGSKDNSYKVVSTMKNETTSNVYMLTIQEFVETGNKPFVFANNADVYYGICSHF